MKLRLKFREPGSRPGSTRWKVIPIDSVEAATAFLNANPQTAFTPAFVQTNGWRPECVAILK